MEFIAGLDFEADYYELCVTGNDNDTKGNALDITNFTVAIEKVVHDCRYPGKIVKISYNDKSRKYLPLFDIDEIGAKLYNAIIDKLHNYHSGLKIPTVD